VSLSSRPRYCLGKRTVAIDGTKIAANASIDTNRDEEWLAAQVHQLVTEVS